MRVLNEYLPKGLFQYFLSLNAMPGLEGYVNHKDTSIEFYDMKMNLIDALDKEKIDTVDRNANDVIEIKSTDETVYSIEP